MGRHIVRALGVVGPSGVLRSETIERGGVTVFGPVNVPSLLPVNASETYARNISDFLGLLIGDGELAPRWDDEIVAESCLTRDGVIVHAATRALVEEVSPA